MGAKHEDSPYVSAQPTMQGTLPEGIERNVKGGDTENRKRRAKVESSPTSLVVLAELAAYTPCRLRMGVLTGDIEDLGRTCVQ